MGQAVSPGEGEVLAGHGDGAFRQGGDVGGAGQAPDGDVLQGQVPEGAGVVVPVAAVIVIDQVVQMLEGAIPDHPILTVPPAQVVVEGVIGEGEEGVVPPGGAVGIFPRPPEAAVFHQEVPAPEAEAVAGGVEAAIPDHNVFGVISGDAVVPGAEVAAVDPHLGAVMEIDPVMAAQHRHVVHSDLDAGVQLVAPVGGVAVGVAPEGHAAAAAEHHTHGPPEALLPLGVQAVGAVDPGAGLADDRHVLGIYGCNG